MSRYQDMRVVVMFDLPMDSRKAKQEYTKFRRFLIQDGYVMVQYSVYSRFCRNTTNISKHVSRLRKNTPRFGNVRILQVTEKQYIDMEIIVGESSTQEKSVQRDALTII